MKIWIFFHGPVPLDPEYPEALSAMKIEAEAKKRGYEVEVFNPDTIDLLVGTGGKWKAMCNGRELGRPDVIIPRTGSETTYAAYSVMRFYERLGVPFLNTPRIIETVSDKLHTMQVLAAHDIPVPRTILGKFPADVDMIEREIGFPVVVKSLRGTRGSGVFLAQNKDQFKDLTDLIADTQTQTHFLFQRYIARSHGRDLRVFVVDGKVYACMERTSQSDTFKANLSRGGSGRAHPITKEIEALALAVAKELRLSMTGIDLLFDDNGYTVCEANSSPVFEGPGKMDEVCNFNSAVVIVDAAVRRAKAGKTANKKGFWSFLNVFSLKKRPSYAVQASASGVTPAAQAPAPEAKPAVKQAA